MWSQLALLHDAGITHRQVDLDRIVRHADGTLGFGDLSSASVTTSPARQLQDQAQMLALSIATLGEERALAVARTAVGAESLPQVLPYLQDAGCPAAFALSSSTLTSTSTRCAAVHEALGAPDQPLIRLRRVTWGTLLNVALLAIAAFTLIGLLGDLDLESFAQELKDASWWWLAFAVVLAQLLRHVRLGLQHHGLDRQTAATRAADLPAVRHHVREPRHPEHCGPSGDQRRVRRDRRPICGEEMSDRKLTSGSLTSSTSCHDFTVPTPGTSVSW